MQPAPTLRPTRFSVAGFKAMPPHCPPSLPLDGVVVLMGSNSAGKSSLLLALRLLVTSLIQEPRLERLHLRAPGLPHSRLLTVLDLQHIQRADLQVDGPVRSEIEFRVMLSDATLLSISFETAPDADNGPNNPDARNPSSAHERSLTQPVALWPVGGRPHIQLLQNVAHTTLDPWAQSWQVLDRGGKPTSDRLAVLRAWAFSVAFLDSIRGEQATGITSEALPTDIESNSVASDGSNAAAIVAALHDGGYGRAQHVVADEDIDPRTSLQRFLPRMETQIEDPDWVDHLSQLLEWVGLEPLEMLNHAPGYSAELRTAGTHRALVQLGDGQRQVLPVLVQALLSRPRTTLCWEHPDLHLHPGAATGIGRLAYRLASAGRTVILETHSRDLVDGIRTEAATIRIATQRGAHAMGLRPGTATLLYLERTKSRIRSESYDLCDPDIEIPMWPRFIAPEVRARREFEVSLALETGALSVTQIKQLLDQPEGQHLERKASLSWNLERGCSDPEVTFLVMKAIAGFCNHPEGGTVLLGVTDDGRAVGIDPNLQDFDEFQKHLVNVVGRDLGMHVPRDLLRVSSLQHGEVQIALVHCRPAREPIALRNKKHQRDDSYVRIGNTTRAVPQSDIPRWIRTRFGADRTS